MKAPWILLLSFLPLPALATSVVSTASETALTAEPYCEVEATYLGEHVPAEIVYWRFSGSRAKASGNIQCDALVRDFVIRIFGAKRSLRLGKVVYPEYIPTPESGSAYRMQLLKRVRTDGARGQISEWTVRNWREGFEKVSR